MTTTQKNSEHVEDKINPDIAWIYFNLGWMKRLLGDCESAIDYLRKAVAQWSHPDMKKDERLYDKCSVSDMEELNKEVNKLQVQDKEEKKRTIYIHSRIVNIYVQIGTCYYELGDTEEARAWYNKMRNFEGEYLDTELTAQIYNNYALTYQKDYKNQMEKDGHTSAMDKLKDKTKENFERTIVEFKRLKKRDEFMALAICNAGAFYLECGETQKAITYFNKAFEIRDTN